MGKYKKKKIYVGAYLNYNLGDDLFLKILVDRYNTNKYEFIAYGRCKYQNELNVNIKIKHRRFLNKLIKILSSNKKKYENILMKKSEFTILIGGSMFIQKGNNNYKDYYIGEGKPYYILGSNFGPYKSQDYYKKFYSIFEKAEDVCFREKYSYDLFSKLPNIRYASDIVFSLNCSNIKIKNSKKVIFSIIDCNTKIKKEYEEIYDSKIQELTRTLIKKGYDIVYMSFCKAENDEVAIDRIINKFNINEKAKISKYFYRGNIEEALNILGDSEIIVGSRFHANILGLLMNKTIIPIAYSDKTINALNDMGFKEKIIDIRRMKDVDMNSLNDKQLKYKLNVDYQMQNAEKHFEKLDKVLEKRTKK